MRQPETVEQYIVPTIIEAADLAVLAEVRKTVWGDAAYFTSQWNDLMTTSETAFTESEDAMDRLFYGTKVYNQGVEIRNSALALVFTLADQAEMLGFICAGEPVPLDLTDKEASSRIGWRAAISAIRRPKPTLQEYIAQSQIPPDQLLAQTQCAALQAVDATETLTLSMCLRLLGDASRFDEFNGFNLNLQLEKQLQSLSTLAESDLPPHEKFIKKQRISQGIYALFSQVAQHAEIDMLPKGFNEMATHIRAKKMTTRQVLHKGSVAETLQRIQAFEEGIPKWIKFRTTTLSRVGAAFSYVPEEIKIETQPELSAQHAADMAAHIDALNLSHSEISDLWHAHKDYITAAGLTDIAHLFVKGIKKDKWSLEPRNKDLARQQIGFLLFCREMLTFDPLIAIDILGESLEREAVIIAERDQLFEALSQSDYKINSNFPPQISTTLSAIQEQWPDMRKMMLEMWPTTVKVDINALENLLFSSGATQKAAQTTLYH